MSKIYDQKLKNFIWNLYKDSSTYWNWSTADAIRYEKTTGIAVQWLFHSDKWQQTLIDIENHINSGILTGSDKNIATSLIQDLRNALNTK